MKNYNVRRGAHWMMLSLMLAAAGCGDDGTGNNNGNTNGNDNGTNNGTNPPPPVQTNAVNVADFQFTPPDIQVAGGAMVTWTWSGGGAQHNVTFAANASIPPSATQTNGMFQAAMPTAAGVYTYQCTIHPAQMNGSVTIP